MNIFVPAAALAERISLFLASFIPYFGKMYDRMLPIQHARCTVGPSFPRFRPEDGRKRGMLSAGNVKPDAQARMRPTDLMRKVHLPR